MGYNELEQEDTLSCVRVRLATIAYLDILLCSIWAIHKIRQSPSPKMPHRSRPPLTAWTNTDIPTSQLDFSCCIQYTRRLTSILDVLTLEGGGHHDVATTQSAQRRAQPLSEPANRAGVAGARPRQRLKRCRSRPRQPHHAHHAEASC